MSPIAIESVPSSTQISSLEQKQNLLKPIPHPEAYGVSSRNGFLPSDPPIQSLRDSYYEPWERIAGRLPALILSQRLRREVDELPILSTERLHTEAEWQRACAILGFLTHSYIWAGDQPSEVGQQCPCLLLNRD